MPKGLWSSALVNAQGILNGLRSMVGEEACWRSAWRSWSSCWPAYQGTGSGGLTIPAHIDGGSRVAVVDIAVDNIGDTNCGFRAAGPGKSAGLSVTTKKVACARVSCAYMFHVKRPRLREPRAARIVARPNPVANAHGKPPNVEGRRHNRSSCLFLLRSADC